MHEYIKRLRRSVRLGVIDQGSANQAVITHDVECHINDFGLCNCDPIITIETNSGPMEVRRDGTIKVATTRR